MDQVGALRQGPGADTAYQPGGARQQNSPCCLARARSLSPGARARLAPPPPLQVTEADIAAFENSYRGGEEEASDVLRYYAKYEGHMGKLFQCVMCSDPARDSHRFMDLIDAAISEGRVERFKRYSAWAKRTAAKPRPPAAAAAAAVAAAHPGSDAQQPAKAAGKKRRLHKAVAEEAHLALAAQIRGRQQSAFAGLVSSIEAKYGVAADGPENIPTEEEFEAARQRLEQRKNGGSSSGSRGKAAQGARTKAKK